LKVENSRLHNWLFGLTTLAMAGLALLPMSQAVLATVVFGVLGLLWLFEKRFEGAHNKKNLLGFGLVVLWLGWGMISAFESPQHAISIPYMLNLTALSLAGLVIGFRMEVEDRRKVVLLAGLVLSITVAYSLGRFAELNKAASPPFFQDTNFLSAAAVLLLPFLTAFAWKERKRWTGWMAFGMMILMVVAIVIFRSRAAWLSLIAAALVVPVFVFPSKKWKIAWISAILIIAAGYFTFRMTRPSGAVTTIDPIGQLKSIGELNHDFSNRERLMRWECAWRMAVKKPLFGEGPGRYPLIFKDYLKGPEEVNQISYWFGWRFGAHSDSLTTLAEMGFLGFFAFVGVLIFTGFHAIAQVFRTRMGFSGATAALLGLLTWVVHGCFNDLLSSSFLVVWGFWMIGTVWKSRFVPNECKASD
jgi:O-antigen ligase